MAYLRHVRGVGSPKTRGENTFGRAEAILSEFDPKRVAIAGFPRAGKTTLAGPAARSTDSVMDLGWSESSERVAGWFSEPGPLTVEGMAVPRALRKWLDAHPVGRPVDELVWLSHPREKLSPGQESMGRGAETVLNAIRAELERRGVKIRRV